MKILKNLMLASFLIIPVNGHCRIFEDIFRLESNEPKIKGFSFHSLSSSSEKWSGGFIKYRDSSSVITLVLKNIELERLSDETPYQATRTWYEMREGKVVGEYEMITQGSNIYSTRYKQYRTGREVNFLSNPALINNEKTGCDW